MESIPQVIIALPVYQGENYLKWAIESLLNQTYKNYKLIICDDASTDKTNEICKFYQERYPNIKYSRNPINLGAQENLLKILNNCESEYFVWASQDDYWDKDYLLMLIEYCLIFIL